MLCRIFFVTVMDIGGPLEGCNSHSQVLKSCCHSVICLPQLPCKDLHLHTVCVWVCIYIYIYTRGFVQNERHNWPMILIAFCSVMLYLFFTLQYCEVPFSPHVSRLLGSSDSRWSWVCMSASVASKPLGCAGSKPFEYPTASSEIFLEFLSFKWPFQRQPTTPADSLRCLW